MSSGNIYAQLRSWYTGLRSASDFNNHSRSAALDDTVREDVEDDSNEDIDTAHNFHHELLATPHIINRPWPAPQQALRSTLSNASLNKPSDTSYTVIQRAEEGTDKDRNSVEPSYGRANDVNGEDPSSDMDPTTPQSSPGRNSGHLERRTSQSSSSIKSDRSELWTLKSNRLRIRLERGKSASTVGQPMGSTAPSYLTPPTSKRRHTGGQNVKPSNLQNFSDLIGKNKSTFESTGPVTPSPQQAPRYTQSGSKPDDPRSPAKAEKYVLPENIPADATSSSEQDEPRRYIEQGLMSSRGPQAKGSGQQDEPSTSSHVMTEGVQDETGNILQPQLDSEPRDTTYEGSNKTTEVENVEEGETLTTQAQNSGNPQADSVTWVPDAGREASTQHNSEQDTDANAVNEDCLPSASNETPAITLPGALAKGGLCSKSQDASQSNDQYQKEEPAEQKAHKVPAVQDQVKQRGPSTHRTDYLSFVDTSFLYDPPPLGPVGFFPKEAFPRVELLRVF